MITTEIETLRNELSSLIGKAEENKFWTKIHNKSKTFVFSASGFITYEYQHQIKLKSN